MMLIANFSSSQESTYPVDTNLFLDQVEPPKDDYLLSMLPEFSESIPVDTFSELNPVGGFFELNPIDDSFINEFILPTGDALFTEQIPDEFQNPNTDLVADSATGCSSLSLSRSRVRSRSDVCPAQDRYLTVNTDEDVKKYWCFKINPDFANIPVCRIRNTDVQIMEERLRALTGDVSSDVLPQVEFSYLVEGTLRKSFVPHLSPLSDFPAVLEFLDIAIYLYTLHKTTG